MRDSKIKLVLLVATVIILCLGSIAGYLYYCSLEKSSSDVSERAEVDKTTVASSKPVSPVKVINLAEIWPGTEAFIKKHPGLMKASEMAAKSSKIISFKQDAGYKKLPAKSKMLLVDADTVTAAVDYAKKGKKVLIVNFANNYTCGGGYKGAARAQEEDIFRRSTAAFALSTEWGLQKTDFYADRGDGKKGIATGEEARAIITTDLKAIRGPKSTQFEFLPEEAWQTFSMITVGAYDINSSERKMFVKDSAKLNATGAAVMKKRIALIFQAAAALNCDTIIAGAIGCGAFGNDPEQIAQLHKEVIEEMYPDLAETIVFAIPRHPTDRTHNANYDAFNKVLFPGK